MAVPASTRRQEVPITEPQDVEPQDADATEEPSLEALATGLAAAALNKKAQDVVILDLRGLVDYTDCFVLATGSNPRQARAIADAAREWARVAHGLSPVGTEGRESARWILVDFGEVVVHVFDGPMRGFYDLDGLWADAPRLPIPEVEGAADPDPLFSIR